MRYKSSSYLDTTTSQQKGRRIPLQLQTAVDAELRRLLEAGHIKRVDSIRDDVFIQPTVITVKKDRSVKIALDARALNAAIRKDKYPMPNLDHLIDQIAEIYTPTMGKYGLLHSIYSMPTVKYRYTRTQQNTAIFRSLGEKCPEHIASKQVTMALQQCQLNFKE